MSIAQSRPETTRVGGVTGKGFTSGVSGNPGGRPYGRARTADRIEAGKWLADRGFGNAPLVVDACLSPERLLEDS